MMQAGTKTKMKSPYYILEYWKNSSGNWNTHLKSPNGDITEVNTQGYERIAEVYKHAKSLQRAGLILKMKKIKAPSKAVKNVVATPRASLDPIASAISNTPNPVSVPGAAPVPVPYPDPMSSDSTKGSKIKAPAKSKAKAPAKVPAKSASKRVR